MFEGYEGLKQVAKLLVRRTQKDWDAVICISGEEGSGKSMLASELGMLIDPDFNFEDNEIVSADVQELSRKLLGKQKVVVADEAIKILYKMHWASTSQKFLNTLYALARKENKITILCIPRFRDLNEFFRNHRVRFWIHVLARGQAIVFSKDWSPFAKDPWWMDENQKMIDKNLHGRRLLDFPIKFRKSLMMKFKNYSMDFEFPDLDDENKNKYQQFVARYKFDGVELFETLTPRALEVTNQRNNLIKTLVKEGYSSKKITEIVGLNLRTVQQIIANVMRDDNVKDSINILNSGVGGVFPKNKEGFNNTT